MKPTEIPSSTRRVEIHIPFTTLLKVAAFAGLLVAGWYLSSLLMILLLSVLVAVTLRPVLDWLIRYRLPQWAGMLLISLGMIGTIVFLTMVVFPPLVEQVTTLLQDLPRIKNDALSSLPSDSTMGPAVRKMVANPSLIFSGDVPKHLLSAGGIALGGVTALGLLLILSLYLVVDGPNAFEWLIAFFTARNQAKLRETGRQVSRVISAYVAGQFITSALVTVYAFAVLSFLKVPAALLLAILAGVFDILPIVGFFLSTIPAMLLALTVSIKAAGLVLGFYVFYHAVENYFIVPKVYGNRLRLSTLVVLLALLAGGLIAGVPGAIVILPIVASYPIIEKIWLARQLGPEVIEQHEEVMADDQKDASEPAKDVAC